MDYKLFPILFAIFINGFIYIYIYTEYWTGVFITPFVRIKAITITCYMWTTELCHKLTVFERFPVGWTISSFVFKWPHSNCCFV